MRCCFMVDHRGNEVFVSRPRSVQGVCRDRVQAEIERVTQQLASRIQTLETRYAGTLPRIVERVGELEQKVDGHLRKMGLVV